MARISPEEFFDMMVLERLEPFGEVGEYVRAGRLAALIANIHRDPKRKSEPYSLKDFAPELFIEPAPDEEVPVWQQQHEAFQRLMEAQQNAGKIIQGAPIQANQ